MKKSKKNTDVIRTYTINGEQVAVTEEQYQALMRPEWKEDKENERKMKCFDEKGNICTKSCAQCDAERAAQLLFSYRF